MRGVAQHPEPNIRGVEARERRIGGFDLEFFWIRSGPDAGVWWRQTNIDDYSRLRGPFVTMDEAEQNAAISLRVPKSRRPR
jgi:hypothetical protein